MDTIFNIAICDDNKCFLDKIKEYVIHSMEEFNLKYTIKEFYNGVELVKYCKKNSINIIIADIEMPVMNGFKAVELLQKSIPDLIVIFVTSHDELAYQAYDYQPFWFIRKNEVKKLDDVLQRCIRILNHKLKNNDICHINIAGSVIEIDCSDIMYIENEGNYVKAYAESGKNIRFRSSLELISQQLKEYGFIRVQRSYIVNAVYISRITSQHVLLKNNLKITLTRNKERLNEIKSSYIKFMREQR